jgi:hypothetical protein
MAQGAVKTLRAPGVPIPPLCGPHGAPLEGPERAAGAVAILGAIEEAVAPRTKRERLTELAWIILENLPKLAPSPKPKR